MRDTIEFIVLIVLLVAGQFAVDERRRSVAEGARTVGMWALFFGGVTVLMFFPALVAWIMRALWVMVAYWILRWVYDGIENKLRGPAIAAAVKPKTAVEIAREVLLDGLHASPAARREFGRLKPSARKHDDAVFLRAVFMVSREKDTSADAKALADTVNARVEKAAADVDRLCAEVEQGAEIKLGRWDRRLVAEALLVYDADSVAMILARDDVPLGSRAARKATVLLLAEDAGAAPWQDLLAQVGLYHPPHGEEEPKKKERTSPGPGAGRMLMALVLPPTAFLAIGERRRAAVLAAAMAALLGYALYALAAGRAAGWIFLATWGLIQIMAMFSAWDAVRDLKI